VLQDMFRHGDVKSENFLSGPHTWSARGHKYKLYKKSSSTSAR